MSAKDKLNPEQIQAFLKGSDPATLPRVWKRLPDPEGRHEDGVRWWFQHDDGFHFALDIQWWNNKTTQCGRDMYANGVASEAKKKQPTQKPPPPPPPPLQPSPQVAAETSSVDGMHVDNTAAASSTAPLSDAAQETCDAVVTDDPSQASGVQDVTEAMLTDTNGQMHTLEDSSTFEAFAMKERAYCVRGVGGSTTLSTKSKTRTESFPGARRPLSKRGVLVLQRCRTGRVSRQRERECVAALGCIRVHAAGRKTLRLSQPSSAPPTPIHASAPMHRPLCTHPFCTVLPPHPGRDSLGPKTSARAGRPALFGRGQMRGLLAILLTAGQITCNAWKLPASGYPGDTRGVSDTLPNNLGDTMPNDLGGMPPNDPGRRLASSCDHNCDGIFFSCNDGCDDGCSLCEPATYNSGANGGCSKDGVPECTDTDCVCELVWINKGKIIFGCSNPHSDPAGPWCAVSSSSCATAAVEPNGFVWSYCSAPTTLQPLSHLSCASCVEAGAMWCAAGAWCAPYVLTASQLAALDRQGDALLCPTATSWTASCTSVATGPLGSDPMYEAQSWVYDLINVRPAWQAGYTGSGVQVAINDDGIDLTLTDFGPLPDGSAKFDADGSCLGADACIGAGSPFQGAVCHAGTGSDGLAFGAHGTACASIAVGNADGTCSVGIAPSARLAGCASLAFASTPFDHFSITSQYQAFDAYLSIGGDAQTYILAYAIDRNDISSNSWGADPCIVRASRRRQRQLSRRRLQTGCPFQTGQSPCTDSACSDWSTALSTSCEAAIRAYCTSSTWTVTPRDPECENWWYLHAECSYTDLSDIRIRALQYAVMHGRQGRGTVYVVAAGNEDNRGEDVNYEDYLFTRYTIAVGAVGKLGKHSSYSTAGVALLVSAPGGDFEYLHNHVVAQPTQGGSSNLCGNAGVGTSYAAPVVSGVIALVLQANPSLSWRDVQGVLVTTASQTDPTDNSWITNAAGLNHSRKYGFGLIDAHAAVMAALNWEAYGPEQRLVSTSITVTSVPQDGMTLELKQEVDSDTAFVIEHVYVYLDLDHSQRGDLEITLVSPGGTESALIPGSRAESSSGASTRNTIQCSAVSDYCRYANDGICDFLYCGCDYTDCGGDAMPYDYGPSVWNWKMTTVSLWGEDPTGIWTLKLTDRRVTNTHATAVVNRWSLYIYGHIVVTATTMQPPSPSPEPPASPGAAYVATVSVQFTVSGDAASFDVTGFKEALSRQFPNVQDIEVSLLSGSIILDVLFITTNNGAAESIATMIATTPALEMSTSWFAGSVQVEAVTAPVFAVQERFESPPRPPQPPPISPYASSSTDTAVIFGTVGGLCGGLLICIVCICHRYRKKRRPASLGPTAESAPPTHHPEGVRQHGAEATLDSATGMVASATGMSEEDVEAHAGRVLAVIDAAKEGGMSAGLEAVRQHGAEAALDSATGMVASATGMSEEVVEAHAGRVLAVIDAAKEGGMSAGLEAVRQHGAEAALDSATGMVASATGMSEEDVEAAVDGFEADDLEDFDLEDIDLDEIVEDIDPTELLEKAGTLLLKSVFGKLQAHENDGLPPGWRKLTDEEDKTFFSFTPSGQWTYDHPSELPKGWLLPKGWKQLKQHTNGRLRYYNTVIDECTETRPTRSSAKAPMRPIQFAGEPRKLSSAEIMALREAYLAQLCNVKGEDLMGKEDSVEMKIALMNRISSALGISMKECFSQKPQFMAELDDLVSNMAETRVISIVRSEAGAPILDISRVDVNPAEGSLVLFNCNYLKDPSAMKGMKMDIPHILSLASCTWAAKYQQRAFEKIVYGAAFDGAYPVAKIFGACRTLEAYGQLNKLMIPEPLRSQYCIDPEPLEPH